jgi:hypothetical protein
VLREACTWAKSDSSKRLGDGQQTVVPMTVALRGVVAVLMAALYYAWEEPLAKEPKGVYKHSDGRPLLGRKIAGKSQRELRDLGLVVEDGYSRQPPSRSPQAGSRPRPPIGTPSVTS